MNLRKFSVFLSGPGGLLALLFFFAPWITVSCNGDSTFGVEEQEITTASGYQLASSGIEDRDIEEGMARIMLEPLGFDEEFLFTDPVTGEPIPTEPIPATEEPSMEEAMTGENRPSFFNPDARLFAIPLVGFLGLVLAVIGFFEGRALNLITAALIYLLPALLGLGIMTLKFVQIRGDIGDINDQVRAESAEQQTVDPAISIGPSPEDIDAFKVSFKGAWWMTVVSLLMIGGAGVIVFLDTNEYQRELTLAEKGQLREVQAMISEKRFAEAVAVLRQIDHPIARKALAQVQKLAPTTAAEAAAPDSTAESAAASLSPIKPLSPRPTPAASSAPGGAAEGAAPTDSEKLQQAKALILQKNYAAARAILHTVQNPVAQKWLAKLDEIDQPPS